MSDFHQNSFEKAKQNQERLGIVKVIGVSMYPLLDPNAEVPLRLMTAGTQ